jgi:Carboxypeptidase regulatory-like domain/TonB dependent receptor
MNRSFSLSPVTIANDKPRRVRPARSVANPLAKTVCGLLLLLLSTLGVGTLSAQTFYGSIGGVVTDPSGAVAPGVAVTVHEDSTTTEYKTVTNNTGSYRVSFLVPGTYTVRFSKKGFDQSEADGLNLVLNQNLVVDGALRIGAASDVVTVSGSVTALNDTNAQVGGQLSSRELVDLPEVTSTHGANEFLITNTFAGIASTSADYTNVNNLSLGGGRPDTNPLIIDGLPSNMGVDGTYGLVPTPDSTEELQVLTSPFSAQYGQSGGGAVLTTTKSGTGTFHGSAFETYNSQALNALSYFTAPGTVVPPSMFNYFGASIGGPVLLPRLFDGRKRHLFFFTDWEDTLTHAVSQLNSDVPTTEERIGNFAGLTPEGTPTSTIYDPQTTQIVNGKPVRTAFQGNTIPTLRLDQVGQNIASFFPLPNCSNGQYNYCVNPISVSSYLYNASRIDYNYSDYDHIWAKFARDGPTNQPVQYISNAANTSALNGWVDDHYEVSWSHIFSPRISNEARIGYVSEENFNYPAPASASSIGLQGVPLTQFPSVTTNEYTSFGAGSYQKTRDGHYIYNDALVLQMGKHTLSIGGEFMRYAYSYYDPGVLSGTYDFSGIFTSAVGQSGNGLADLELGLPATTTISTTNTIFHENLNYIAGYIQDDYRLSDKLTINLGLRYEFDGPFSEVHNNMYIFDPNIIDPTTQQQGGIQFAGYDGAPRSLIANVYTGVLPRFGAAYHLFHNTVIRGGYGIYELPSIGFGTEGFTSASTVNATFQSEDGVTPAYELNQGVPAYSPNVGANGEPLIPASLTAPSSNVVELQQRPVLPYLQEWSLSGQQDLGHAWIAEVDYEGNHGVHLPISLPINQINPPSNCCFGVSNAQSLRPYPQFLDISYLTNGGASEYAALLATLTHSWGNGISVRAAYTYAHALDDVDAAARSDAAPVQNVYNLHAQWGTAMTNVPQRFSLSAIYALPIGAGSKVLTHTPVVSQVIGHWKISTVAQFQKGYPYFIAQSNTLGTFSGAQYVTEAGNPNVSRGSRTIEKWFNRAAFQVTPQDTLGNAPRAALYGPGQNVWDVSLMRDVPLGKRATFTFRADAHNALNHPQFDGLNTTITNPAFGSVTSAEDPRTILLIGRLRF